MAFTIAVQFRSGESDQYQTVLCMFPSRELITSLLRNQHWLVVALVLAFVHSYAAVAQPFPSRPVKIVVPFAQGSFTDISARRVGERLSKAMAQQVSFENRAGEFGNLGAQVVARADPDGHTLLMATGEILTINEFLRPPPFDPATAFQPITMIAEMLKEADMPQSLSQFGARLVGNTPDEFSARIAADRARWEKLVKAGAIETR